MRSLTAFSIAVALASAITCSLVETRADQPAPLGASVVGPTAIQQSRRCPPKGPCTPAVTTFGYFEPGWRTWPGEQRLDKINPSAIGRERIPTPPPAENLPLPVPEAMPPQGPPQRPLEGGPLSPGLPTEVLPPGEPRGPVPGIEIPAETDILPPLPRGGDTPGSPVAPTPAPEPTPAPPKSILPDAPPPPGLPIDPTTGLPPSRPDQSSLPPARPSPQGYAEVYAPAAIEPRPQGYAEAYAPAPVEPRPQLGRMPWQDVPLEPAPSQQQPGAEPSHPSVEPTSIPGFSMVESVQPVTAQLPVDVRGSATARHSSFEQPVGQTAQQVERAWQAERPPVAFDGFCPVDLSKNERWTKGDPRWAVVHQGQTYLLSGPVQRECFMVDPARYTAGFSGCDPVAVVDQGSNVPGCVDYCVTYDGKIYIFSSAANLAKFRQDARRYTAMNR